MATPKSNETTNWLQQSLRSLEQRKVDNPVIDQRWWVCDYFPEVQYWHDEQPRPARAVRCSDYFSTREEADEFVREHNPEKDAELRIYHQNKRRITTEEWVNW